MESTRRELILAALVILALFIGVGWYTSQRTVRHAAVMTPPPLTDRMKAVLAKSKGFNVAISYSDTGFQPIAVTVHAGDAVRFTNNSSGDLWVSTGSTTAPCDTSVLDSCMALHPNEFWEYTFAHTGTMHYVDSLHPSHIGTIVVE